MAICLLCSRRLQFNNSWLCQLDSLCSTSSLLTAKKEKKKKSKTWFKPTVTSLYYYCIWTFNQFHMNAMEKILAIERGIKICRSVAICATQGSEECSDNMVLTWGFSAESHHFAWHRRGTLGLCQSLWRFMAGEMDLPLASSDTPADCSVWRTIAWEKKGKRLMNYTCPLDW